ncbi:MAG: hypothetical protein ACPL3P_09120 [Anaerolineales bacterium]
MQVALLIAKLDQHHHLKFPDGGDPYMEEERYTKMIFSSSEILYILASLGLSTAILTNNPFKNYTREALRQEIVLGREALENKGLLIRTASQSWELDGRIIAMMDLIARADRSLHVTLIRKPAEFERQSFFLMGKQVISLMQESRYYHLGIFQSEKAFYNYLLTWVGVAEQLSQNLTDIRLPIKNFASMIIGIWSEGSTPAAALRTAGLEEEAIYPSSLILEKSDTAAMLIPEFKGIPLEQTRHGYLLSSKTFLFWGESVGGDDAVIAFHPLPFSHTVITKVPDYYEEMVNYDPNRPNVTANVVRLISGADLGQQKK